jgi:hypothetical protein
MIVLPPSLKPRRGTVALREGCRALRRSELLHVTLLYASLTTALTWPLVRGLARDLPGDLGDPLFVTWILAWDAAHIGPGLWHANVFAPHPLTLAYSEHLLPQAIRILPAYALTNNPILCYNLTFLFTFVVSGIGMFLFVRDLTGNRAAGVIAGLAYAFAPYRIGNLAHLPVLSSEWMPFVLFGLRRHFTTGRIRPLTMAGGAWLLQNLSCGYYLFFFSPVVAAYIVWELASRRLWMDRRTLIALFTMSAVVASLTAAFLLPYVQLRRLGAMPRSVDETIRFSADVHAYFTAAPGLWIAGRLVHAWPKPEGLLFPGFTIAVMAAAAVFVSARTIHREEPLRAGERLGTWALAIACCVLGGLLWGWTLRLPGMKVTSLPRAGWITCGMATALLALSERLRARACAWLATPAAFFTIAALFAVIMSFGPEIRAGGRLIAGTNLYLLFYRYVPGFDGVRVPSRFGMIVALALSVLAGLAVSGLPRRRFTVPIAAALIAFEASSVPLKINDTAADYEQAGLAALSSSLETEASRALYGAVARLADRAVIVELPLGEPAFDIRYMFYSTRHWKRLVNGYSGGRPAEYNELDRSLRDVTTRPDYAWGELRRTGATHAIVHEAFYVGDRGKGISAWLRKNGARDVASFGADHIFELPASTTTEP